MSGPPVLPLLEVIGLTARFGGLVALDGVTFSVAKGAMTGIIGPNGAGKTTLLDVIGGFWRPDAGDIVYDGRPVALLPAQRRARLGITRTFQNVGLFESLSVADNVRAGVDWHRRFGGRQSAEDAVRRSLDDLALSAVAAAPVRSLSLGWRRRAEIARALAGRPKLLLLDEPTAGLLPEAAAEIGAFVRRLAHRDGITVLLVEHNVPFVLGLCERLIVLEFGRVIADGPTEAVRNDPAVVRAYLGAPA